MTETRRQKELTIALAEKIELQERIDNLPLEHEWLHKQLKHRMENYNLRIRMLEELVDDDCYLLSQK